MDIRVCLIAVEPTAPIIGIIIIYKIIDYGCFRQIIAINAAAGSSEFPDRLIAENKIFAYKRVRIATATDATAMSAQARIKADFIAAYYG